jgi:hypothetical protein
VISLVRQILAERWMREISHNNGTGKVLTIDDAPQLEILLGQVSGYIGNCSMLGFLFGSILEYIDGAGMYIIGLMGQNTLGHDTIFQSPSKHQGQINMH